jgi:hypothetical protein
MMMKGSKETGEKWVERRKGGRRRRTVKGMPKGVDKEKGKAK